MTETELFAAYAEIAETPTDGVPYRMHEELRLALEILELLRAEIAELRAELRTLAEHEQEHAELELLTLSECGRRLGIDRHTVASWIAQGRLPAVGRRYARRVPAAALEQLAVRS
jgi:excisionase family DNA binding protein